MESITIGMDPTAVNSLIYIAKDQDYFAANGLNVTIKDYTSGLAAVNGMLKNEVDIATAAEFVIVGHALKKESVRSLGSIDKFLHIYLVGRRDRGVRSVADLKGKRIGVTLKTAAEFYLGRFLDLHGMNIRQVALVNVSPLQSVDALVNGDVDAVIAWQPNVKAMEDRLGSGVVKWGAQEGQAAYCTVVGRSEWVAKHPELIKRFLTALAQAENYNASHPAESKRILQKMLHWDDSYMAAIWPEHQFSLSLDQALILAMEDETRWMINNNLTTEKQVPDFMNYIYVDGLKAVKPEAVNIIR
jgi:NitT/TauT family transport system substrate-binding protein